MKILKMFEYWSIAIAATLANMAAIGIGRFSFVPIFPAIIKTNWISTEGAILAGSIHFLGYLVGTLLSTYLGARYGSRILVSVCLAAITLSVMSMATLGSATLYIFTRATAGFCAAIVMTQVGPLAQSYYPPSQRTLVSGIAMSGVGLGIVLSMLISSAISVIKIDTFYYTMGFVCLCLIIIPSNAFFVKNTNMDTKEGVVRRITPAAKEINFIHIWKNHSDAQKTIIFYGLSGAAIMPHMLFTIDYASKNFAISGESLYLIWTVFGLGATIGAFTSGILVNIFGLFRTTLAMSLLQLIGVSIILIPFKETFILSVFLSGMSALGISSLVLIRCERIISKFNKFVWIWATSAYAICQAIAAVVVSLVLLFGFSYHYVFSISVLLSFLVTLVTIRQFLKNDRKI